VSQRAGAESGSGLKLRAREKAEPISNAVLLLACSSAPCDLSDFSRSQVWGLTRIFDASFSRLDSGVGALAGRAGARASRILVERAKALLAQERIASESSPSSSQPLDAPDSMPKREGVRRTSLKTAPSDATQLVPTSRVSAAQPNPSSATLSPNLTRTPTPYPQPTNATKPGRLLADPPGSVTSRRRRD
jgi:hypothetical protein